jgi:hypothetical protein
MNDRLNGETEPLFVSLQEYCKYVRTMEQYITTVKTTQIKKKNSTVVCNAFGIALIISNQACLLLLS